MAVIAGPPEPVVVSSGPALQPSCGGVTGAPMPGIRLAAFAAALGSDRARFMSMCSDTGYDAVIATITDDLTRRLGR